MVVLNLVPPYQFLMDQLFVKLIINLGKLIINLGKLIINLGKLIINYLFK